MIRFRRWIDHNRRALKDIAAKRRARGISETAPLSLERVIVAVHLDTEFAAFAEAVGGAVAETFFLRALQYAADHDGHSGAIRVDRARFAAVVLSRPWHVVHRSVGERVYDALLASTICVSEDAPLSADKSADETPSCPRTGPRTSHPETPSETPASGGVTRGLSRELRDARTPPRDARAPSNPGFGPRTGPRTCPRPPSPSPSVPLQTSPGGRLEVASLGDEDSTPPRSPAVSARQTVRDVVAGLSPIDRAEHAATVAAVVAGLAAAGWAARPAETPDQVDILAVAPGPVRVALEVDHRSVRERSHERLREHEGLRVVVLRERPDEPIRLDGIDVLVAGHEAPRAADLCEPHRRRRPCSVCEAAETPRADPTVRAQAIAEMRSRLGRPATAALTGPEPTTTPETTHNPVQHPPASTE